MEEGPLHHCLVTDAGVSSDYVPDLGGRPRPGIESRAWEITNPERPGHRRRTLLSTIWRALWRAAMKAERGPTPPEEGCMPGGLDRQSAISIGVLGNCPKAGASPSGAAHIRSQAVGSSTTARRAKGVGDDVVPEVRLVECLDTPVTRMLRSPSRFGAAATWEWVWV